ncbi:hypothetical protein EVAR_43280_1 [Eumeta japonica]|uniref:HAT C-terminal dimerisation domain-containing protein n=1 Tax=Eumeta variegata TaxID=151549 RepID=A0A4C1WY92_EUMVA|nr:hypothetical protein EVAR_43280_1 [Eumeta japonica]
MSELLPSTLTEKAISLEKTHPDNLETDLVQECIHFQCHLSSQKILKKPDSGSLKSLSLFLRKQNLENIYPNLDIALSMALCTPVTNCSEMPRNYKIRIGSRNYKNYSSETLKQCLASIRNKELTQRKASDKNFLQCHETEADFREIDDPGLRSTEAIRVSPQPSTSSADILLSAPSARVECPSPLPEEELSNGHQVAREIDRGTGRRNGRGIGWVRGRVAGRGSTRGTRQKRRVRKGGKSPDREDSDSTDENDLAEAQVDLEENASDEDEDMWKKSSWTADRPEPDIFDSIPLSPTRMLPSNARPIRHFEKFYSRRFELIVRKPTYMPVKIIYWGGLKSTSKN